MPGSCIFYGAVDWDGGCDCEERISMQSELIHNEQKRIWEAVVNWHDDSKNWTPINMIDLDTLKSIIFQEEPKNITPSTDY